jgi:hypothetical protein
VSPSQRRKAKKRARIAPVADVATSVLESAFPPITGASARERFAARSRMAEALSNV